MSTVALVHALRVNYDVYANFHTMCASLTCMQDSMEEIQFEPSIVPISPLQDGVKFMYFGNTSSEAETTVELNPFFTSEEVKLMRV